jgi:hypothetical protein
VFVSVWGKLQPCIASGFVSKDTTLNVQVGAVALSGADGAVITGVVYELIPDGRRPLRGATAWLDIGQEAYVANTETDESGRFSLCGLNTNARLDVYADGYQPYAHAEFVSGAKDSYFEFEFTH